MIKKIITLIFFTTCNYCYGETFNLVCSTLIDGKLPTEKQIYIDTNKKLVTMNDKNLDIRELNVDKSNIIFLFPENIGNVIYRINHVTISRVTGSYKQVVNGEKFEDIFTYSGKCEPRKVNKF